MPLLAGLRDRSQRPHTLCFRDGEAGHLDRRGCCGRRAKTARNAGPLRLPQQPAGAAWRWRPTVSPGVCATPSPVTARPASAFSSAPAPPASCRPSWPTAAATRIAAPCPAISTTARTHNTFSLAEFAREYFGLEGPAMVISTACSSSAKVFAAAARQLACGTIDAAVVGGVDSLCLTTLYGFASLQLTSSHAVPALRRGAQRHFDRRGRRLRAARTGAGDPGARRAAAARQRRVERRLSHVVAASGRPRCPAGDGSGAALGRPDAGRHRLHQPARHRDASQRCGRRQGRCRAVRRPRRLQFDQGRHRPHAGRRRRDRSRDLRAGA